MASSNSAYDENEWVMHIKKILNQESEEEIDITVTIFGVPKTLMTNDPECYVPQRVAIGPYHYTNPELREMERHKLDAAKIFQKQLRTPLKLHSLAEQMMKLESRIRVREKGIILNHLKSDWEVANVWNGMNKSVRLTKVALLDKVIDDVNKYYNCRWNVKTKRFMKSYIFGSWQFLTFLATTVLLLLMVLQSFCSIYTCSPFLNEVIAILGTDEQN